MVTQYPFASMAPFARRPSKGCGSYPLARGSASSTRTGTRGFTYIGLLFAIVLMGVLLSATGVMWNTEARREKEAELLFVGIQYQHAIASYYAVSNNGKKQFPPSVDELLLDRRFPMPVRHLRKRFVDPMTSSKDWGLVRDGNGIHGVYSLSEDTPLKISGFAACCENFGATKRYSDWKFIYHNTDG